ncbi:MAG: hypothetical protein NTY34_06850 [Candidatus Omnitrophica bacterium]|nr:hypothetical protein [Candidatus Omnitrophota bacterium]
MKISDYFRGGLWDKIVFYITLGISVNILIFAFTFYGMGRHIARESVSEALCRKAEKIANGNFYSMQIDAATDRLFACDIEHYSLKVFDLSGLDPGPKKIKKMPAELQDVRLNEAKRELYYFDRTRDIMLVYDADSLRLKRRSSFPFEGGYSARVSFDNRSHTIAVAREKDYMWIIDMETLLPVERLGAGDSNEFIIFNEKSNRYILSYFKSFDFIRLVSPDGKDIREIRARRYQGGLAASNKNNELYVALPLRGEISVYDLKTFALKRKIPTVFGVRGIACDEENNIIVAASMCTGYVDVIDLGTDRRISRDFVGYYLREICLNLQKEEAFISSIFGVYRLSLELKNRYKYDDKKRREAAIN